MSLSAPAPSPGERPFRSLLTSIILFGAGIPTLTGLAFIVPFYAWSHAPAPLRQNREQPPTASNRHERALLLLSPSELVLVQRELETGLQEVSDFLGRRF
jgi:hypothetical protein